MRVHLHGELEAGEFAKNLLMVGDGLYPINQYKRIVLNPDLCQLSLVGEELIEKVFPNIEINICNHDWLFERAILAPTNDRVDELNHIIQEKLSRHHIRTYYSIDRTVDIEQVTDYPVEFLNSLNPSGLPLHELTLRVGSPIMVLRNLDPPRLCNGTRLCIKKLHDNLIEAVILAGQFKGDIVFIPRIPMIPKNLLIEFKRTQFPVKLAYCFTINKSQGQSLKVTGIDLTRPCFSHGQLYVACSRVGSKSNLHILSPGGETKNVVYRQILR